MSSGPVRELNPGPLAPKARIMPLDQQANDGYTLFNKDFYLSLSVELSCDIIGHARQLESNSSGLSLVTFYEQDEIMWRKSYVSEKLEPHN